MGRFMELVQSALVCGEDVDPPFPGPVPVLRTDDLHRSAQIFAARVSRRYPGHTPVFMRHGRAWRTDRPSPGPSAPSTRPRPLLYGVTCAWNAGDVIWATVRNLFGQGADRVFVIDDESSDDTVAEARAAGAEVVAESTGGGFTEEARASRLSRLIDEETATQGGDVWWISVDTDEFPRGPGGGTIRELVEQLPPWVDVAGSRVLEHSPGPESSYAPHTHPVATIPLARRHSNPYCSRGHWKHQLFRQREPGDLYTLRGGHTLGATDGRRVREAEASLLMHHVQYRERAASEAWLTAALGRSYASDDPTVHDRLERRLEALPLLYAGRYEEVPNYLFPGERRRGLVLSGWQHLVPGPERSLPGLS